MRVRKPQPKPDFPKLERAALARWQKEGTFEKSLAKTKGGQRFTFYDGPPFATGLPHYGHLLAGTVKDVFPRYQTMRGYYVERRFGWDCHGLPVEYEMEKELGIRSRQEILAMGVDKFNEACRGIVLRYTKEWEKTTTRLGRWIDFQNDYKTMDPDYMESIWWVVKQLWEKDLLYEGRKSMHICPRCATPLSNYEVSLGYADRTDPAVFVKFPLVEQPAVSVLAWTTTPWTLPGNVLLAINPKLKYVEVEHEGSRYILAASRVEHTFQKQAVKKLRTVPAKELLGQQYEAPFPLENLEGKHYEVVAADFVTDEDGTGVAHEAPAFGEEDMALAQAIGAPLVQHVDMTGHFTEPFPRYHDKTALEANDDIIAELKEAGRLLRKEKISHSYPHCWRCDTPLLNYAAVSWFVKVTDIKQDLLKANQQINWVPAHIKEGRFGKGLEDAPDWSISRNRFWGNPLPIWRCQDEEQHVVVVGSLDELEKLSGERPVDLHKHFVDKITFPCPDCGGEMKRIEDVLDCWFESGSMPYAERHYPFEHKGDFKKQFPADFISEGLDQTRGWFYTLHVLATALFASPAFRNVVLTGLVMAEDGKKMSKKLKNYPEPERMFERYGADAVRLYMLSSPIVRGDNLAFAEKGVAETMRSFAATLWNTYDFLATYAKDADIPALPAKPVHILDRWVLARLAQTTSRVTAALDEYDLMTAVRELAEFLEELSNWYVRRSRQRFLPDNDGRQEAISVLHHVLSQFCLLAAPLAPFVTDNVYQGLGHPESVHLADWPEPGEADEVVVTQMNVALQAVRAGLAARNKAGRRLRQPLPGAVIAVHDPSLSLSKEIVQTVKDELNVKELTLLTDEHEMFSPVLKPIPREVAKVCGSNTQAVIDATKAGDYQVRGEFVEFSQLKETLPLSAFQTTYQTAGAYTVERSGEVMVALSTEVDQTLEAEGLARELTRSFQELRKEAGLEVGEPIVAAVQGAAGQLSKAIDSHRQTIEQAIAARSLELDGETYQNKKTVEVDENTVTISLKRA